MKPNIHLKEPFVGLNKWLVVVVGDFFLLLGKVAILFGRGKADFLLKKGLVMVFLVGVSIFVIPSFGDIRYVSREKSLSFN